MIWITDGTFEGCLTGVYEAFYARDGGEIWSEKHWVQDLLEPVVRIETDGIKASKVASAIDQQLGTACFKEVLYCFFSESPQAETIILHFLQHAFKKGAVVLNHESHPAVAPLLMYSRKTSREAHKFLGLLRFMELESGLFYAPFEPTQYLLPLMASHFSKRISDRPWVIHDLSRQAAAFFDTHIWHIATLDSIHNLKFHSREASYQAYWQVYFKSIAIASRSNPRLQSQFMPKKYWKYLVEKQS